jgi:hypothetical protein
MTRESNPVPEGSDLQSSAVANAARHPETILKHTLLFMVAA